jgi:hypothetical protein
MSKWTRAIKRQLQRGIPRHRLAFEALGPFSPLSFPLRGPNSKAEQSRSGIATIKPLSTTHRSPNKEAAEEGGE